MLVKVAAPEAAQSGAGQSASAVATQARSLEAVLWNQVLSGLSATAFPGGALGTGSDGFNSIAEDAVSQKLFSGIDSTLTKQIVDQAVPEAKSPVQTNMSAIRHGPFLLSMAGAESAAGSLGAAMDQSVTGLVQQGVNSVAQAASFAKQVWPSIVQAANKLKVPPVAVLAQAALETGWGASVPANNMFGVKSTTGAGVSAPTQEEVNGSMVSKMATFAAYPSVGAAADSYAALVRTRYPDAVGAGDVSSYASALAAGGWATDQSYAAKIVSVANSPLMGDVLQMIGAGETP